MASMVLVRHQCDKCRTLVDLDPGGEPITFKLPQGWERHGERVLCPNCAGALRRFVEDNESVEQSP